MSISVGQSIWVCDPNSRYYRDGVNGRHTGKMSELYQWRRFKVIDETRVSWVVNGILPCIGESKDRFPKNDRRIGSLILTTWQDVLDRAWVDENINNIASAVRELREIEDREMLQAIADVMGITPFDPAKETFGDRPHPGGGFE